MMTWTKFILSVALVAVFARPALAASEDVKKDFDRAADLVKQGLESEALTSLYDFVRRYPDDALVGQAHLMMADLEFRQRDYSRALGDLNQIVHSEMSKSKSRDTALLVKSAMRLADVWIAMGEPLRAKIELEAIMRKYPTIPEAFDAKQKWMGLPK